MPKSWKPEVQVKDDERWYDNALRFETKDEAEAYARDLFQRWFTAVGHRAAESDDPVSFKYVFDGEDKFRRLVIVEEGQF